MKTKVCVLAMVLALAGCAGPSREDIAQEYPYNNPLSSPGQKFSGLPPAVQSTIRAQAGAAEMHDILKNTNVEPVVYEVHFRHPERFPPLFIAPDGSVLFPHSHEVAVGAPQDEIGVLSGGEVSGLRLGDLPPAVVTTIQEKAPTAEVAFINRVVEDGKVFYNVSFKDAAFHPSLLVAEDGGVVKRMPQTFTPPKP